MKRRVSVTLLALALVLSLLPGAALAAGGGEGAGGPGTAVCICTEPCTPMSKNEDCPVCNVSGHWEGNVYIYESGAAMTEEEYTDATDIDSDTPQSITVADYYYLSSCESLKQRDTVYVDSEGYTVYTTTAPNAEAVIGAGDGTRENPYQNLQTALYNVKPGGTIIVLGSEVKSVAPAIHAFPNDLRENILELDRPVSIKAESAEGVAYAGQIKFQKFPGRVQASWTGTKNAEDSWDTFCTNNTISGVVEFDGINFTHTGGDVISNYSANAVLEGCELVITDCEFSNMQAGSAIRISSHMKSVTITDTDFTVTRKPEDGYQKAYLVWTDSTKALDISGCTFDGNGAYRAAVHVGNGHLDGEEASITGCTFKGFERCIQLALINKVKNTTTIEGNTFENIRLSKASGNTTNAYEYGAVFIHETHQKHGNFGSTVTFTGNQLTGTSDRWIYTESAFPIEYFNISMDGEALENMDFHRHLDEGAVTYYPKYPVLAPVTDGSGYGGYILKAIDDAFTGAADGDTLTLLRDVSLGGQDTPESATAAVAAGSDISLVLPPEITLAAPVSGSSVTVAADKTLTLSGWYEDGATGNEGESGGALVIGDEAQLTVSGTLYNGGNIVLQGEDGGNLSGVIVLRLGGEVYSGLDRDEQVRNWIKYEGGPYYTSGVTEGYTPKYVYYGPTVSPVDITVYMGGEEGYDGAVNGDGSIEASSSLPVPGFEIELPDTLEAALAADGKDVTALRFESGSKQWQAVSYDGKSDAVYRLEPCGTEGQDPVRVQFKDGDEFVTSDSFDVGEHVNQTLEMSIYPGDPVTSVTVTYDGYTYDVDFSAAAELTVRGTTSAPEYAEVEDESGFTPTEGEPGLTAPDGTAYTINNGGVEADAGSVALLFDGIIEEGVDSTERAEALAERGDKELGAVGAGRERHYEFKYLDLVDRDNGNVWVKASEAVTVYWPLPEGADASTLKVLHFKGLHREMLPGSVESEIEGCDVEVIEADVTDTHVVFEIGEAGFSPFALVWEEKADTPVIVPPTPDDGPDDVVPPMLNGDDHFAYVIGYEDGTVKPNGQITRAEVATIIFRLLDPEVRDANLTTENSFTDVSEGSWYNTAVSTLVKLGIISGRSETIFDPNAPITRAEFATLFARFDESGAEAKSTFSDVSTHWARESIELAAALGWINGYEDGTFRPDNRITRAEAMTMINRVLNRDPVEDDDLLPNMRTWTDNQPGTWYYFAVQEATNSHEYTRPDAHEDWTEITADPDWTRYQ